MFQETVIQVNNNVYIRIFITSVFITTNGWERAKMVHNQDLVLISYSVPSQRNLVRVMRSAVSLRTSCLEKQEKIPHCFHKICMQRSPFHACYCGHVK